MLQNTKELYGDKLAATDGDLGHLKDFYFDDRRWVVRYLVADTGSWLSGRLVLLSPHAFGRLDQFERTLHVKLLKRQIENSPPIEAHPPVSRQYEVEYYRYYGWPAYWNGAAMWGAGGFPIVLPPSQAETQAHLRHHRGDDPHLRSTKAAVGYEIQATDGPAGQVTGFIVDDRTWTICGLTVETGHWYSGKEVVVAPGSVRQINYEASRVTVNLSKAEIQRATEADLVQVTTGESASSRFAG